MMERLTENQVRLALGRLNGWKLKSNAIVSEFVFADFNQAFAVMTRTFCMLKSAAIILSGATFTIDLKSD